MGGVALVIPVINEGETMTAARARQAGALVIVEPRSGYGAAGLPRWNLRRASGLSDRGVYRGRPER